MHFDDDACFSSATELAWWAFGATTLALGSRRASCRAVSFIDRLRALVLAGDEAGEGHSHHGGGCGGVGGGDAVVTGAMVDVGAVAGGAVVVAVAGGAVVVTMYHGGGGDAIVAGAMVVVGTVTGGAVVVGGGAVVVGAVTGGAVVISHHGVGVGIGGGGGER